MTDVLAHAVADAPLAMRAQPFYLPLDPDPVFALLHLPEGPQHSSTGVVLCPPFGWDELCAHRSLRAWATALAHAGYPALRFDFPGTGDSGGSPRDPQRLQAWTAAVDAAAGSLKGTLGCQRIVAIGIGLGGMVACRAATLGGPIDDLVLWAVQAQGRLALREMRAFARILYAQSVHLSAANAAPAGPADSAVIGEGALNASGFLVTAETVAALESLDLTILPLPEASGRRILLLGSDTAPPDRRICEHFAGSGAEVTISDGPGFGTMMVDPQFARVPHEVFARTISWLAESPAATATARGAPARPSVVPLRRISALELAVDDARIRETPFEFDFKSEQLSGVLTEPVGPAGPGAQLCAVLLNAGAVRRIGHHRMWVDVARRWAARGVPSLRLDVAGVGDSDGAEGLYTDRGAFQRREFGDQVLAAFDELERRGLPGRFIVGGLCSGAYWGLHAALADERVDGLLLVNLLAFFWSDDLGAARDARRTRALLRERDLGAIVRIVAADRWRTTRMARTMLARARPSRRTKTGDAHADSDVVGVLAQMRERRVDILLLLSRGEPLYDDFVADGLLERLEEWPNLHLDSIPTNEHVFRSAWSQRHIHNALDEALTRTLGQQTQRTLDG